VLITLQSDNPSSSSGGENSQDLTLFVQNLLQQMQGRFQTMSNQIIGRIDEMGNRIDDLEKSIGELMAQAGIEEDAEKTSKASSTAAATTDSAQ
jgi:heat shock factor-binding protein 1